MTLRQMRGYLDAGARRERNQAQLALFIARAAQADTAGYKGAVKMLKGAGNE